MRRFGRRALRHQRDGDRIVDISSVSTRLASAHGIGCPLTKGVLDVFSHTLAKHLGPRNITVNSVAVGFTRTDMTAQVLTGPATLERNIGLTALGRIGQVPDIADAVAFPASDDARWITGAKTDVTGGVNLWRRSTGPFHPPVRHVRSAAGSAGQPSVRAPGTDTVEIRHAHSGIPMLRKTRTVTGSVSGTDRRTPGDFCRRNIRSPAGHQRPRTPVAGTVRT
ncbi:SDR family oxidoreductase [Streptomyces sp. NPDC045456]|uniref:SDR family NAD(P)-dependent oxidoreductase n=1 Tax=Streptomyces sp. NPDC045456 TaxID=3155254 RepID=UPI0033FB35FA